MAIIDEVVKSRILHIRHFRGTCPRSLSQKLVIGE